MKRLGLYRTFILAAATLGSPGLLRADDRIEYRDPKNRGILLVATGTIVDEGFTSIRFKQAAGNRELAIPVADVIKIGYELPGAAKLEFGGIAAAEDRQDYAKALEGYKGLVPKVAANERAKRFVDYKVATISAALVAERPDTAPAAVEALKKFVAAYPNTWQTIGATRQLIALQLKIKDSAGALAAAEAWVANDKLPKEGKSEAELARIEVLAQTGKIPEAVSKADALAKSLPAGNPSRARAELYPLAFASLEKADGIGEVTKKFDDLINKSTDPNFKATAYNLLGLCNRVKGQPREAMWDYLWVDAVYNQDRSEQAKALENLIRLFEETDGMKDPEKAKIFRDKLGRIRQ